MKYYIHTYIYMYVSNLEKPYVGSQKRLPQIWDGQIAYHTFAQK